MTDRDPRPWRPRIRRLPASGRGCRRGPGSPGRLFLRACPARIRPARVSVWDYLELCEEQAAVELAARGWALDEHGCLQDDLHAAQCELYSLVTGAMTFLYVPACPGGISAGHAARVMLALLSGVRARRWPPAEPGLPLDEAVARLLRTAGLPARAADVRWDDGRLYPEVVAASPAAPARGVTRLIEDSHIRWDFRFAVPGRAGLTPAEAADAIAAALAVTDGTAGRSGALAEAGSASSSFARVPAAYLRGGHRCPAAAARLDPGQPRQRACPRFPVTGPGHGWPGPFTPFTPDAAASPSERNTCSETWLSRRPASARERAAGGGERRSRHPVSDRAPALRRRRAG
jgi:hypothetical protein